MAYNGYRNFATWSMALYYEESSQFEDIVDDCIMSGCTDSEIVDEVTDAIRNEIEDDYYTTFDKIPDHLKMAFVDSLDQANIDYHHLAKMVMDDGYIDDRREALGKSKTSNKCLKGKSKGSSAPRQKQKQSNARPSGKAKSTKPAKAPAKKKTQTSQSRRSTSGTRRR